MDLSLLFVCAAIGVAGLIVAVIGLFDKRNKDAVTERRRPSQSFCFTVQVKQMCCKLCHTKGGATPPFLYSYPSLKLCHCRHRCRRCKASKYSQKLRLVLTDGFAMPPCYPSFSSKIWSG